MVRFRERLTPSLPLHLALLLVLPMGFGMLAPINLEWGIASGLALYGLTLAAFVVGAPRIVVTESELYAGRAHIERRFIRDVVPVSKDERPGALADARTWKLLRAWIPTGVTITIDDPSDPTPTWYLSTRKPEKLTSALTSA